MNNNGRFRINSDQCQVFKFNVKRPTVLRIRMLASAPVNVLLLSSDERAGYTRKGLSTHSYTSAWGHQTELEATVPVDHGTWYLAVEGTTETSAGRLEVSPRIAA